MKGSMLNKMPGDRWQKFANLRALYAYMYGPSRQEAALHGRRVRPVEGMELRGLSGLGLLDPAYPLRRRSMCSCSDLVRDLNRLLAQQPALHERDFYAGRFRVD